MYDLKYRTNDWWHRAFFFFQLSTYAALASFSGSFNGAQAMSCPLSRTNSTALSLVSWLLSDGADVASTERSAEASDFKGVNLVLMTCNRILLLIQYLRSKSNFPPRGPLLTQDDLVHYYQRRTSGAWGHGHLSASAGLFVSALCFLSAFILVETGPAHKGTAIGQLLLWVCFIVSVPSPKLM